jgi:arginine/lysine/ornithine decarboxylase
MKTGLMDKAASTAAPLLETMAHYASEGRVSFHTPGHQQGLGQWPPFSRLLAEGGQALDLTELPDLDNLAAPAGCIEESQKSMARLAGSQEVFYLVNGSTAGLEAAMLAMSGPETLTVLGSHCHQAIHQGLILTGGRPLILPCRVDPEWGLPLGIDQEAAAAACGGGLPAKGLWVSLSPTYHGLIADFAWEKAILARRPAWGWLADEAHGVHLPFGKDTAPEQPPLSALGWGAHVVVQSAHKMGCGFTQTALLHCSRQELAGKLRQGINILQSSSPSYLLLASLDAWQAWLQEDGVLRLREAAGLARELASEIRALGGYRLWQDELPASYQADPRKITVSPKDLGLDGFALATILRRDYGIDPELAAADYVLFIVNLGLESRHAAYLVKALREIQERRSAGRGGFGEGPGEGFSQARPAGAGSGAGGGQKAQRQRAAASGESKRLLAGLYRPGQRPWQPALSPREAFFRPRCRVKFDEAKGRLAAAALVPSPPGIPILWPGMEIGAETIGGLKEWLQAGQSCAGLETAGGQIFTEVLLD